MSKGKLLSFSPGGEKLAQGGEDGVLRIWDTTTGVLEQEYQSAEHLAAAPTCVQFSRTQTTDDVTPGKKKNTPKKARTDVKCSLVAVGTKAGTVLVYSPEKREIVVVLIHAPPHTILDVAWSSPTRLFSLAADNTLVEWNVTTGNRQATYNVGSSLLISSMCALNGKNVCLGSSGIKHTILERKSSTTVDKREFTGHSSKVSQLLPIPPSYKYFISSSQNERFIYAWNLSGESEEPCVSFMVKDIVTSMAVAEKNNTITLAAATRKGSLVFFTQHLNGNLQKKAVANIGKLSFIHREGGDDKKITIPILCSYFLNDIDESIIVVYGDTAFPRFERLNVQDISGNEELVRSSQKTPASKKTPKLKTITPKVTKDTAILGPGYLSFPGGGETKRKRGDGDGKSSLPMEERLNALAIDKTTAHTTPQPPKLDNQVHLLLQGLHSKDTRLLQPVLSCQDPVVISKTVRRLPAQAIVPLLEYLQQVIVGKGIKNCAYVQWVRSVLYHHMSHLSTLPDRQALVSPFYSVATGKMASLVQMTQLHARLDLMLNHVTTRHQVSQDQQVHPEPLLMYQEESSSEDDLLEATLGGVSESEDNWDEPSDFGDINGHTDESDMEVDQATTSKRKLIGNGGDDEEESASKSDEVESSDDDEVDDDEVEGSDDDEEDDDDDDDEEEEEEGENGMVKEQ